MSDSENNNREVLPVEERPGIKNKMARIKHKIIVLSGKGGVGKSTVAVNMAMALADRGFRVGLLDIDLHGPSIPKLLGLEGKHLLYKGDKLIPLQVTDKLKVMSIGLLLREREEAVIWRGPVKMRMIQQFLEYVDWGSLDFLIVDSPPGTGDEPLTIIQMIPDLDGAIIVTTPQDLSIIDVRRSIAFCHKLGLPVLGVIENMSGFTCPHCGKTTDIFKTGGGKKLADELNTRFLGAIPMDEDITRSGDWGKPFLMEYADSNTSTLFKEAIEPIVALARKGKT